MKWIKVTPETMPPDMVPILVTVRNWNSYKFVWQGQVRFNQSRKRFEVFLADGYASGWAGGEIPGDVTHWMFWPKPAED